MSSDLQTQLTEAEKSFKKACEQIIHLNRRLDEMAKRYDKASRENHRSFRYSLRLRMAVSEGVRNMYYEYAANKADLISELRYKVAGSVSARIVADNVALRSGSNITSAAYADRAEGEQREWGPPSGGGSSTRTNANAAHTRRVTKTTRQGSSTQRRHRSSRPPLAPAAVNEEVPWAEGAADMVPVVEGIPEPVGEIPEPVGEIPEPVGEIPEPVGEIPEPVVTVEGIPEPVVVGGIPEGQYDSSDMGSPSTGSSGSTIASNEASEDLELVESYFTNDYAENSSESSQPSGSNWT